MAKRKSVPIGIPCHRRKRARQPSISPAHLEAATHISAEDHVYCSVCNKKEGVHDFILCDACDGGMHRQCAKLDQIPEGFWACITCEQRPTVESAIRQVLHEHSKSGLSEEQLLIKVQERVSLGIPARPELSKGLEQALNHIDPTKFAREYQVMRLKGRYRLVTTAAADASCEQHLVPDSENEQYSMQSSATLGSEDDAPCTHGLHVRRRRSLSSSSSQHSCPVEPAVSKGHRHNGNSAQDSYRQQKCHRYQKSGVAEQNGANMQVHAEAQQQQSDCAEPQNFSAQTSQGSTGLQQAQQQQQQQQQDSSLDVTNSKGIAHLYACSALAGLARFHAHSAATVIGLVAAYTQYVQRQWQRDLPCPNIRPGVDKFVTKGADQARLGCETEDMLVDSDAADQQLDARAVEAASVSSDQELHLQQATSSQEQNLSVPVQLPSAQDPAKGVACFLSIMIEGDVMTKSVQQQRTLLFRAASQLVGLSRCTKSFEQHLGTLSSSHAARMVQIACSRIMATSRVHPPEMSCAPYCVPLPTIKRHDAYRLGSLYNNTGSPWQPEPQIG